MQLGGRDCCLMTSYNGCRSIKKCHNVVFCNRSIDSYVIQSMNNSAYLWTEAMRNGSLQSFAKINPLVGLPPKTLRLYSVLGVFKKEYSSNEKPDWFRVPEADQRLKNIGLSKRGIEKAFQELVRVELLQIHEERDARWYSLK